MGHVSRLNMDGSVDTSFAIQQMGIDGPITSLALQRDGMIILAGDFIAFNGNFILKIARLNGNGNLDTSFNRARTGIEGIVFSLALQPDNKIVVAGSLHRISNRICNSVVRFDEHGKQDTSFIPLRTGFFEWTNSLAQQPDGKIIAVGALSHLTTRGYIFRMNQNGSFDTSFVSGTQFDGPISCLAIQPDGRVIVAGAFGAYNTIARAGIARLNQNGTLDSSFNPGTGFNNFIRGIALQTDGKVLVSGGFTTYNDFPERFLTRIYATTPNPAGTTPVLSTPGVLLPTPNPTSQTFTLQNLTQPTPLTLTDATGRTALRTTARPGEGISVRGLAKGMYGWRAGAASGRVVVE